MSSEQKKTAISPKRYNELLGHIDLVDIRLQDLKASLGKDTDISDRPVTNFGETFNIVSNTSNSVEIEALYTLNAKSKGRKVFSIRAKYLIVFKTDTELPMEFFDIFNKYSLPLQTFPYLRECVNSIVSRMNLPPLILPLRKYLMDGSK